MAELPLRERHYPAVPEMVRRTDSDVPADARRAMAATAKLAASLRGIAPASPRLVPTADGGIERLLLTIPHYAARPLGDEANPFATGYRSLLASLPDATRLIVLTHEAVQEEVGRWIEEAALGERVEVVGAEDFLGFSVWAEDGYVVVEEGDGGRRSFLEPAFFRRYGDALVAEHVSARSDLGVYQAPLYFQGGNVLVGDDFFFIGIDYPIRTLDEGIVTPAPGQDVDALLGELYRRFFDAGRPGLYVSSTIPVPEERAERFELDGEEWLELKYVGNEPGTRQPIFHIDMFISLAGRHDGRYRLLVGDPREAAELTGEPLQPHGMAPVFDNIAAALAAQGFEVLRNPLPLVYVDDPVERVRTWYFATSNNALVHTPASGSSVVILPSYAHGPFGHLSATDERNVRIWESLGFEVRLLADFHPFAANLGAVHCIKKYLARSPWRSAGGPA